ncbi:hypothetical protein CEXT_701331 [Caerostris extrusa]|uniref:Uncharacterized protein n=1 Tax=Caerostris extrusa TaxID=172846 RepID=A0AAV4VVD3_CAEEX|nr:hypothetical protein CEXT_701331 [Caerostris extrusa]
MNKEVLSCYPLGPGQCDTGMMGRETGPVKGKSLLNARSIWPLASQLGVSGENCRLVPGNYGTSSSCRFALTPFQHLSFGKVLERKADQGEE